MGWYASGMVGEEEEDEDGEEKNHDWPTESKHGDLRRMIRMQWEMCYLMILRCCISGKLSRSGGTLFQFFWGSPFARRLLQVGVTVPDSHRCEIFVLFETDQHSVEAIDTSTLLALFMVSLRMKFTELIPPL